MSDLKIQTRPCVKRYSISYKSKMEKSSSSLAFDTDDMESESFDSDVESNYSQRL